MMRQAAALMQHYLSLNAVLQGTVLVTLLIGLLVALEFHPRLSIISSESPLSLNNDTDCIISVAEYKLYQQRVIDLKIHIVASLKHIKQKTILPLMTLFSTTTLIGEQQLAMQELSCHL